MEKTEEKTNKAYMYVVECADGTLYTGYTTNVEKRIKTHNSGKGAKYTRSRLPVKLIYQKSWHTYLPHRTWSLWCTNYFPPIEMVICFCNTYNSVVKIYIAQCQSK